MLSAASEDDRAILLASNEAEMDLQTDTEAGRQLEEEEERSSKAKASSSFGQDRSPSSLSYVASCTAAVGGLLVN